MRFSQSIAIHEGADHRTEKEFGKIDVLVNNAGTNHRRPFHMMKFEDFWHVNDVNYKAVIRYLLRSLIVANVLDAQTAPKNERTS
jgi:NADP-dependent 3-hydroxy acid dehydrogenase YdfG